MAGAAEYAPGEDIGGQGDHPRGEEGKEGGNSALDGHLAIFYLDQSQLPHHHHIGKNLLVGRDQFHQSIGLG